MEALELEDTLIVCKQPAPIPKINAEMTLGVFQNFIKACGGPAHPRQCFDYHSDKNEWLRSNDTLHPRVRHAASFIGGYWLLSGGSGAAGSTTEFWNGTAFVEGPSLPRSMRDHCQVTVDETHVFFATGDGKPSYLLNWSKESYDWTELDPTTSEMRLLSCGLIKPYSGPELVVASQSRSQIFDLKRRVWREGPDTPYFDEAGHAQLADTFIVVGGRSLSRDYLDTIYKFDYVHYTWELMEQKLQVAVKGLAVVTVPDHFLSCKLRYPDRAFSSKYSLVSKNRGVLIYLAAQLPNCFLL